MKNLKLKGLRVSQGYTQEKMGKLLGITDTAYRRKENGFQNFTQREIDIILNAFKVKYEDIFLQQNIS